MPGGEKYLRPASVAVDQEHHLLFVADSVLGRVYVYRLMVDPTKPYGLTEAFISNEFRVLRTAVQPDGSTAGEFEFGYAQALSVSKEGADMFLYVVDKRRHTVDKFKYYAGPPESAVETVAHVATWGGFGSAPGKLILPYSMLHDPVQNRVFVTDALNGRLQVFNRAGQLQDQWGRWSGILATCAGSYGDSNFQEIQGVATACGRPVVVSYGNRLAAFSWKGDLDADGDVDAADQAVFTQCMQVPPPLPSESECWYADLDADGDVDTTDQAVFSVRFTGPVECNP